jgi:tetratricopeptide (TPR) repeat protein
MAGRSGDAIDQLRKFTQSRDGRNEWKAYRVLGDLFVSEFPRLAQGSYEKAAELNPNEPSVLSGLSICASKAGNFDEAIRLARQAADADGLRNARYSHRLARALMARQMFDESEKAAAKALELAEARVQKDPGRRTSLQSLMDQYGLLMEIMAARILVSPTVDPDVYIRLAEFTGQRADVAHRIAQHDMVAVLEAAVTKTVPDTPMRLREKYAAQLAAAGRTKDAIAEYETILAADPEHKTAGEALALLRRDLEKTQD